MKTNRSAFYDIDIGMKHTKARAGKFGKLGKNGGYTLIEMMFSTLIVGFIAMMMVSGAYLAQQSYMKVVDRANAEVLLSTTVTMLRSELSTASGITVGPNGNDVAGKAIRYNKGTSGYVGTISSEVPDEDGVTAVAEEEGTEEIMISEYGGKRQFVSDVTATNGLKVSFEGISYSGSTVTVTGLAVKNSVNRVLASLDTLVIDA